MSQFLEAARRKKLKFSDFRDIAGEQCLHENAFAAAESKGLRLRKLGLDPWVLPCPHTRKNAQCRRTQKLTITFHPPQ